MRLGQSSVYAYIFAGPSIGTSIVGTFPVGPIGPSPDGFILLSLNRICGQKCSTKPFKICAFVSFCGCSSTIGFQQVVYGGSHDDTAPLLLPVQAYLKPSSWAKTTRSTSRHHMKTSKGDSRENLYTHQKVAGSSWPPQSGWNRAESPVAGIAQWWRICTIFGWQPCSEGTSQNAAK